jgi:hypothetical protein
VHFLFYRCYWSPIRSSSHLAATYMRSGHLLHVKGFGSRNAEAALPRYPNEPFASRRKECQDHPVPLKPRVGWIAPVSVHRRRLEAYASYMCVSRQ